MLRMAEMCSTTWKSTANLCRRTKMEFELAVNALEKFGVGFVCLAVLIFLHIYNVKVVLPNAIEENRKERESTLKTFKEELAAERKQCQDDHLRLEVAVV